MQFICARSPDQRSVAVGRERDAAPEATLGFFGALWFSRLPERFRAPILLCDLEDVAYEEAARLLGCPVGTVKSRLARGRER